MLRDPLSAQRGGRRRCPSSTSGALHHPAFKASTREEVDGIPTALVAIDAYIVSPPREYPECVPRGYYAVFFKDPCGIKFEVVTSPRSGH